MELVANIFTNSFALSDKNEITLGPFICSASIKNFVSDFPELKGSKSFDFDFGLCTDTLSVFKTSLAIIASRSEFNKSLTTPFPVIDIVVVVKVNYGCSTFST